MIYRNVQLRRENHAYTLDVGGVTVYTGGKCTMQLRELGREPNFSPILWVNSNKSFSRRLWLN